MKFKMRYADQLVGILVVVALVSIIFVIFMLGKTQRWFSRTYNFVTYAQTASGLNQNMPVNCRGIPIGNLKSFRLTEDNVIEVIFAIHSDFIDRAKEGSLVEVSVSPIGFGSQFIFYPGLGNPLEEGALVPMRNSPEGQDLIARGLANIPHQDDLVGELLANINTVVDDIGKTLEGVNLVLEGANLTLEGLNVAPNEKSVTALGQTIANVQELTANLTSDFAEADVIYALESSLFNLSGILDNLEKTTHSLPKEMPHIYSLIYDARGAVRAAENVLVGLQNNPLLRKGIPEQAEIDSSGTNPRRNIRF
ncbi:MAG: MlaD family protein [Treponema sp.]|jgi:phospholipid/cholesterol/gamma-HCH transport system substrate-binding protein|nr:MlaD family protein [Treponema sp.]